MAGKIVAFNEELVLSHAESRPPVAQTVKVDRCLDNSKSTQQI